MKNKVFTAGLALLALTVFFASCENHAAADAVDYGSEGKFVAIASGSGETAWSADGKTWASGGRLPAEPDTGVGIEAANWIGIAYGRGKLAAVSYGGEDSKSVWSADGLAWTEADSQEIGHLQDIAYGNGKFVAVANSAYSDNRAGYSEDGGSTWTGSSSLPAGAWYSVAYGNGKFVAVDGDNNKTAASADGAAWTAGQNLPAPAGGFWRAVVYGNGKFIAFSSLGDTAYSADDGATWSGKTGGLPAGIRKAVYGGRRFVAVSDSNSNSNNAAWSDNGVVWTAVTLPETAYWQDVAYGKGVFAALARGEAAWSEDGKTWTAVEGLPELQQGATWAAITFMEAF